LKERHDVLVIEDDEACSENVCEILDSIGCNAKSTDNAEIAVALLDQQRFCFFVLDLAIKKSPKAMKGHTTHGLRVLKEIRNRYGPHQGLPNWTPVVVVSGNANELDEVIQMMSDGGVDDIIRKPISIADTTRRLERLLERSGRLNHSACLKLGDSAHESAVPLEFTGKRDGQRIVVRVGTTELPLQESSLQTLLELALANAKGEFSHKRRFGRNETGVKRISKLKYELKPALGDHVRAIANNRKSGYALSGEVRVMSIDLAALKRLRNAEITRIATELVAAREGSLRVDAASE
jgi:DNA-binding response OmpR family regulator